MVSYVTGRKNTMAGLKWNPWTLPDNKSLRIADTAGMTAYVGSTANLAFPSNRNFR